MEDHDRIKMLQDYCYCPSYRSSGTHGAHPKCRECRYNPSE